MIAVKTRQAHDRFGFAKGLSIFRQLQEPPMSRPPLNRLKSEVEHVKRKAKPSAAEIDELLGRLREPSWRTAAERSAAQSLVHELESLKQVSNGAGDRSIGAGNSSTGAD
jgi:hypothetical protein